MIKHSHLSFSTAAPCVCELGWHPPFIHGVLSMHLKFYFECKFTTHLCSQSAHLPKIFLFFRFRRKSIGKFETKQQEQTSSIPADSNNSKDE